MSINTKDELASLGTRAANFLLKGKSVALFSVEDAYQHFARTFGGRPTQEAKASGRVNLMGDHADYNGGWMLPTATPLKTRVLLRRRTDRLVVVTSLTLDLELLNYELGQEKRTGTWRDYVQGVTKALAQEKFPLGGFDAWIESDLPMKSGLSSSTALEIALLRALGEAFGLKMPDTEAAALCLSAEKNFVGARTGFMDPLAVSLGGEGAAILLDTQSLENERIPLPPDLELMVLDSGVSRRIGNEGYQKRREECEQACRLLGTRSLRDLRDRQNVEALPEPLNRRVRHILTENERVHRAASALKQGDLNELGRLINASHDSMRVDYEVSLPEIDQLIALALAEPDVYGARLTGRGFGGCIVGACRKGTAGATARRIARKYGELGRRATVLLPVPG